MKTPRPRSQGERNHAAILRDADIPVMRSLHFESDVSSREIARRFGVSRSTAWRAIAGATFRHLHLNHPSE